MAKTEERIDKWLWAMRVFKTRTIATDACKKGRVTMNGTVLKPSRSIKVGDIVDVRKPPITYTFRVLALAENRLGAKLVPDHLENLTPPSQYECCRLAFARRIVRGTTATVAAWLCLPYRCASP